MGATNRRPGWHPTVRCLLFTRQCSSMRWPKYCCFQNHYENFLHAYKFTHNYGLLQTLLLHLKQTSPLQTNLSRSFITYSLWLELNFPLFANHLAFLCELRFLFFFFKTVIIYRHSFNQQQDMSEECQEEVFRLKQILCLKCERNISSLYLS